MIGKWMKKTERGRVRDWGSLMPPSLQDSLSGGQIPGGHPATFGGPCSFCEKHTKCEVWSAPNGMVENGDRIVLQTGRRMAFRNLSQDVRCRAD